jgi:hypothetical protein
MNRWKNEQMNRQEAGRGVRQKDKETDRETDTKAD